MSDKTIRQQQADACVPKLERALQEANACGVSPRRIAGLLHNILPEGNLRTLQAELAVLCPPAASGEPDLQMLHL